MTNVDSQRIKEIRDNTRAMAEAFGRIADTLAEALELYVSTQTETQNSNLTFEKRTMRDCYNCKRYDTEGECIECHYEPKTEPSSSEIPNNCEHITEDGVTCAKYPACDDCLDNPLNKVKGSERLVKGKDEPQLTPNYCGTCKHREVPCGDLPCDVCHGYSNYEPKDEPQTDCPKTCPLIDICTKDDADCPWK